MYVDYFHCTSEQVANGKASSFEYVDFVHYASAHVANGVSRHLCT